MRFDFANRRLERLYTEERGANRYPDQVVEAFFEVVAVIGAAASEQDLRNLRSLRFEKLKGKRKEQRSVRLHGGWRLVFQILEDQRGLYLLIEEIVDYHRG